MPAHKNIVIPGPNGRPILTDIFFESTGAPKPVLIYAHGFNGFKDWGGFDSLALQIAASGFALIKFNFSFNGTTPDAPEEFVDLEGYAENNYSKELDDLGTVIDWAIAEPSFSSEIDASRIGLIGHSRGGGVVIIKAAEDRRVGAIATWASVSASRTPWGGWPPERMAKWKEEGVQYVTNSRTKQDLPLHYQLYEDHLRNKDRLDVVAAMARLTIPALICHGTEDESVALSSAYALYAAQPAAELFTLPSDHVFGRKHPWTEAAPPAAMQQVLDRTLDFFHAHLK